MKIYRKKNIIILESDVNRVIKKYVYLLKLSNRIKKHIGSKRNILNA